MNMLVYRPLLVSVFVLQALAVSANACSRWSGSSAAVVTIALIVLSPLAYAVTLRLGRRAQPPSQQIQLLQGMFIALVLGTWYVRVGIESVGIVGGFALLLARSFTRITRRDLYFDLSIIVAIFYDAVSTEALPWRWAIGTLFLAILSFVLIADYTDRRLRYVRVGDARGLTAMWPSVRNAVHATAVTILLSLVIYIVMPQPKALQIGWFPDRGPPVRLKSDAAGSDGTLGEVPKASDGKRASGDLACEFRIPTVAL